MPVGAAAGEPAPTAPASRSYPEKLLASIAHLTTGHMDRDPHFLSVDHNAGGSDHGKGFPNDSWTFLFAGLSQF